ncbi:radial spoke head protein 9 homolog [Centruroides vittatus]|uniref:radial spoke head protein 9 homolog n=1 Tax=Centruroides vittatus TaxID=120091 RepID=UPI0035106C91
MNVFELQDDINTSSIWKSHLNLEERIALANSLEVIKGKKNFQLVQFWGKIIGKNATYYILIGRGEDILLDKSFYYSFDCLNWNDLPIANNTFDINLINSTFIGYPSYIYKIDSNQSGREVKDEDAEEDKDIKNSMYEEERIAKVVAMMEDEVSIAPIGAYIQTVDGTVKPNPSFSGLSKHMAIRASSYVHLRKPATSWTGRLWKNLEFLQPITEDIIPDQWMVRLTPNHSSIMIMNYLWPGMVFYHKIQTKSFSQLYIGDGRRNNDLQFMF